MSRLVTIGEAARALGVSERTLRRYEQQGLVKPIRTLGGQRRYHLQAIRDLLHAAEDDDGGDAQGNTRAEPHLTPPRAAASEAELSPWDEVEEERASFEAMKVRTAREDFLEVRRDNAARAELVRIAKLDADRRASEARVAAEREEQARAVARKEHDEMVRREISRADYYMAFEPNEAGPAIRKTMLSLLTPGRIPLGITASQLTQLVRDEIAKAAAPFRRVKELRDHGAKYADRELDESEVDYGTTCRIRRAVESELAASVTAEWTPRRVEQAVDRLLDDLLDDDQDS